MKDSDAARLIDQLARMTDVIKTMNSNHVEIGQLLKGWTETSEPEELVMPDREPFVIGQVVRVTDPFSVHYKHIGKVSQFGEIHLRVTFIHIESLHDPEFDAAQLEVLPQPKLALGDTVKVIDPSSIVYGDTGTVAGNELPRGVIEVKFRGNSAGQFERRNLELVEARESPRLMVDMIVSISAEQNAFYGKTGTIVTVLKDTVRVMFLGIEGYSIFTPDEIAVIGVMPYAECLGESEWPTETLEVSDKWTHKRTDPDQKYVTDTEGRLMPWQWRHNLGMETWHSPSEEIDPPHENELMTEEAFRIYNAGLS